MRFDCNYNTFVPTEPPNIGPVLMNSHPHAPQIHRLYDEAKQARPPSHVNQDAVYTPVVCFVTVSSISTSGSGTTTSAAGIQTCMVAQQQQQQVPTTMMSFEEMVHRLKVGVAALTSKRFAK